MSLVPYQRFSVATTTPPAEAAARLIAAVAPRSLLGRAVTDRPFQGWVRGNEFKISRVIEERRNSFVPLLRGRVIATPDGSGVDGTMRLHHAASVFITVWTGIVLVMINALLREAARGPLPWLQLLGVLAMLLGFWALAIGVFAAEARKAQRLLQQALERKDFPAVA
jgi:hypothetical protein